MRTSRKTGLACIAIVLLAITAACSRSYLADYAFQGRAQRKEAGLVVEIEAWRNGDESAITLADEQLEWVFRINDYGISLEVVNKSAASIQLLWDEARFVDETGGSQPVLAARNRWSALARSTGPLQQSELDGRQSLVFDLFPRDYLKPVRAGPWVARRALFEPPGFRVGHTPDEIVVLARPAVGKTIQLLVPSVAGGTRREYEFAFTVTGVGARPMPWSLL